MEERSKTLCIVISYAKMNWNVCLMALMFFSLKNVASLTFENPSDFKYIGTKLNITCESISTKFILKWYQVYKGSNIQVGQIPPQAGVTKTRYFITVEIFDNNTEINCDKIPEQNKTFSYNFDNLISRLPSANTLMTNIIVPNGSFKPTLEPETTKLTYSKTKKAPFSCEEKANLTQYLGVINTSNMINTYEKKSIWSHKNFNKTHNGTILCCIYYEVNETEDRAEKWITRYVTNKKMLYYDSIDDDVWYDALDFTEDNSHANISDNTDPNNQAIKIYSTSVAAIVFILLIIIIIFYKKRCHKKTKSDTKVQYADLDMLRTEPRNVQRPSRRTEEESPYAEIIGVMRPS